MPYLPPPPPPPPPAPIPSALGIDNGVWRLGFIFAYFAIVATVLPSVRGASLMQHLVLHGLWWTMAAFFARELRGLVQELANEDASLQYAAQMRAYEAMIQDAQDKQPMTGLKLNPQTAQYDVQRVPLFDDRMGAEPRP